MKDMLCFFLMTMLLSGCAYVEGVEYQKKAIPIPKSETPPPSSSPLTTTTTPGAGATTQAAKVISPAR